MISTLSLAWIIPLSSFIGGMVAWILKHKIDKRRIANDERKVSDADKHQTRELDIKEKEFKLKQDALKFEKDKHRNSTEFKSRSDEKFNTLKLAMKSIGLPQTSDTDKALKFLAEESLFLGNPKIVEAQGNLKKAYASSLKSWPKDITLIEFLNATQPKPSKANLSASASIKGPQESILTALGSLIGISGLDKVQFLTLNEIITKQHSIISAALADPTFYIEKKPNMKKVDLPDINLDDDKADDNKPGKKE